MVVWTHSGFAIRIRPDWHCPYERGFIVQTQYLQFKQMGGRCLNLLHHNLMHMVIHIIMSIYYYVSLISSALKQMSQCFCVRAFKRLAPIAMHPFSRRSGRHSTAKKHSIRCFRRVHLQQLMKYYPGTYNHVYTLSTAVYYYASVLQVHMYVVATYDGYTIRIYSYSFTATGVAL